MAYIKFKDKDTAHFDVDDTLIIWVTNMTEEQEKRAVQVVDSMGTTFHIPNTPMIDKLKAHHEKGDVVVVWSQGGADWAEAVVKALKLEKYVHAILTKPTHYYDDLEVDVWMPKRIYENIEEPSIGGLKRFKDIDND